MTTIKKVQDSNTYNVDTPEYINQAANTAEYINEASNASIPGLNVTTNFKSRYSNNPKKKKEKNLIAKFFSEMSRLGMNYDDDVIANMRAIPADKSLLPKDQQLQNQDLFASLASGWKEKSNADKNFYEKNFDQKRVALRQLAVQPELEDILDTMTNESIVYDTDYTYFCEPFIEPQELKDLKAKVRKEIHADLSRRFRMFYKFLSWKWRAWDDFKRWLVEGILAWEIVWDSLEKPKEIIGFVPLDPITLTKKFENGKYYWIQYKGIQGKERTLLDSQVIYISYQETNILSRVSYLERLIRPFNLYRIIEQAQVIWTVTNASFKLKFTIPTKGLSKQMGQQTLASAMNRYREDIKFQSDSGELLINGTSNLPFNKEYWFADGDSGTPQMDTIGGDGPELVDNDQLKFYRNLLYKVSKIPLNRFDQESGETWFGADATSVARTEIDFGRFVTRLRNVFSQILIKPLQLQLALDHPELQENKHILEGIQLQFKSYNVFEEMLEIELMQKRMDFIQSAKDSLIDMDMEGNEIKFWSSKFLVERFLKLSKQDIDLNDKYKKEEIEDLNLAGDPDNAIDAQEALIDIANMITEEQKEELKSKIRSKRKKAKANKALMKELTDEQIDLKKQTEEEE